MTFDELIAALEAATGPSPTLDFWCWWWGKATHGGELPDAEYVAFNIKRAPGPRYTSSIDAALSLVLEGHWWSIDSSGAVLVFDAGKFPLEASHTTPTIALCIVALQARKVNENDA